MSKINIIIIALVALIIGLGGGYYFGYDIGFERAVKQFSQTITNFEECAKIYPVMESYPAQCKTPDGKHFTEIIPIQNQPTRMEKITNFEECAQAGGQVMQSYPRQCRSSEGKTFTEFTQ